MKKRALFVGVNEYEDGCIARLDHAVDDAEALAAVFDTLLGFEVKTLKNPGGRKEILRKVGEVTQGLGKGDLFFFYFAGHGFRVKENHVLVCREDSYGDLEDEYDGLPMGQLKKRARGPWNRMLVIDACQNDIRKTRGADEGMSGRDLALILEDGEIESGDGMQVVVTSCSEGQKALEVGELGHGLFTSALLETVKDHSRTRRRLDLDGFRAEVGKRMGELARKYRLGGEQNPLFNVPMECGIVLLEGMGEEIPKNTEFVPEAVRGEVCELCGEYHPLKEIFRCRQCRKWYCISHRDPKTFLCATCSTAEQSRSTGATKGKAVEAMPKADVWHPVQDIGAPIVMAFDEVRFDGGTFHLGRSSGEGPADEAPAVNVQVPPFFLANTPVTVAQFRAFVDDTGYKTIAETAPGEKTWMVPGFAQTDDEPVVCIAWIDAAQYCNWRSKRARLASAYTIRDGGRRITLDLSANGYRMPLEAEWEYAARNGGKDILFPWGDNDTEATAQAHANFRPEELFLDPWQTTNPVKAFPAQSDGLYGMAGNVWEWCQDIYVPNAYATAYRSGAIETLLNPEPGTAPSPRVMRGGSYFNRLAFLRCTARGYGHEQVGAPCVGMRVARNAD